MATKEVILGAYYKHDATGIVMRLFHASTADVEDICELIDVDMYGVWNGFSQRWQGDWDQFKRDWSLKG